MPDSHVRLLFLGGCHVLGYPYGPEFSFPEMVRRNLQEQDPAKCYELRSVPYVLMKHGEQVIRECSEFSPDVLVLQVGHYETSYAIKRRIWSLFHRKKTDKQNGGQTESGTRKSTPDWTSKAPASRSWEAGPIPTPLRIIRFWLDLLLCATGQPGLKMEQARHDTDRLFCLLHESGIRHVIVLSPFLGPSAVINRYRRRLGKILQEDAARYGLTYLDLAPVFDRPFSLTRSRMYHDDQHLTPLGHRRLSDVLSAKILHLLEPVTRNDQPARAADDHAGRGFSQSSLSQS